MRTNCSLRPPTPPDYKWLALLLLLPMACDSDSVTEDGAVVPDGAVLADQAPSPDTVAGPWANVFKTNPVVDNKQTTQVLLANITSSTGVLTGKYVDVWNCLPEPGGPPLQLMGMTGTLCHVKQQALPGADGSYLQIKPPDNYVAGNDSFAEVMMYHHIDTIRRHYSEDFGLKHLDQQAIYALVNLQGYINGMNAWMGMPNAAFSPGGAFLQAVGINVKGDAIVFGFNNSALTGLPLVNFTYDASVSYHEYTHYTIGGQTLALTAAPDKYGLSPTPLALNEGLADYFPSSFLDNPRLGDYALGNQARDLTEDHRCPADLRGESHNDGTIPSGALWAARQVLGSTVLDQAVWNAVLTFTAGTTFDEAAVAILAEIKKVAPDKHDAIKTIFETRGFAGCVRLVQHKDFTANPFDPLSGAGYPGTYSVQTSYPDGLPAYLQYKVAIQSTTQEVTITYHGEKSSTYGSGGTGDVWVALKPGSDAIVYDYSSGAGKHDAKAVLKGATDGTNDKLVLSGDCVQQGDLVFQFLNRDNAEGQLTVIKVSQSDTKTNTVDNFTGCGR